MFAPELELSFTLPPGNVGIVVESLAPPDSGDASCNRVCRDRMKRKKATRQMSANPTIPPTTPPATPATFEDFGEGVWVWVCWEVDVVDGFPVEVVAVLATGDDVEVADGLAGGYI